MDIWESTRKQGSDELYSGSKDLWFLQCPPIRLSQFWVDPIDERVEGVSDILFFWTWFDMHPSEFDLDTAVYEGWSAKDKDGQEGTVVARAERTRDEVNWDDNEDIDDYYNSRKRWSDKSILIKWHKTGNKTREEIADLELRRPFFGRPLPAAIFLWLFTFLGIWTSFYWLPETSPQWLIWTMRLIYVTLFPALAIAYTVRVILKWSEDRADQFYGELYSFLFKSAWKLLLLGLCLIGLFAVGSYLFSIPSWSAVIILLLGVLIWLQIRGKKQGD